jgi:N-acetylmuramic acid 6-phosphate etherase
MSELAKLLTEQRNPASAEIDKVSTLEALRIMNAEDQRAAASIVPELPHIAEAVDGIVERMRLGGRLFYIGAGTSGRLGVLDASECPPTFNVSYDLVQGIMAGGTDALYKATEASEDSAEAGVRDIEARGLGASDILCGIAASGRTPYVLGAVRAARAKGALTLGVSCTPDSELARAAEIPITPLPGPEVITGSTRLKAGTVTKLVLNMLTTITMVRLGYVRGNLMVNVQPKNEKLVDRARRIIAAAADVSAERAAELLAATGGKVREAIERGIREKNG